MRFAVPSLAGNRNLSRLSRTCCRGVDGSPPPPATTPLPSPPPPLSTLPLEAAAVSKAEADVVMCFSVAEEVEEEEGAVVKGGLARVFGVGVPLPPVCLACDVACFPWFGGSGFGEGLGSPERGFGDGIIGSRTWFGSGSEKIREDCSCVSEGGRTRRAFKI